MGGNCLEYAGSVNWNDLPVDAHELVALGAPRPAFVIGGRPGERGKCQGSWRPWALAGLPGLPGKKDLESTQFPPVELSPMAAAFRQTAAYTRPLRSSRPFRISPAAT